MDRQELIDEAIKVTKDTITFCDDWTALEKLMAFVPTERLKDFLPEEEEDQTIEQLEAALERTRKEISNQEEFIGLTGVVQSIDPSLYRREREQARAVIKAQLKSQEQDQ
tara:strand:+ start:158 stop:487 length:330 start_codon:yes stop_codon:yes gene_type:complete